MKGKEILTIDKLETSGGPSQGGRAVSFPLNALLVLLVVAAANFAVYFAGTEYFVQIPSLFVPLRNIGLVLILLVGGRMIMRGVNRRPEMILLSAALLFGVGLAMQFRLGHDVPRQLSSREVALASDTVRFRMAGEPEDSIKKEIIATVRSRNGEIRRDFDRARIDTRLARTLEETYGATDTTAMFLSDRPTAPMDALWFRLLPAVVFLAILFFMVRSNLTGILTSQWRAIGLYGSLGLCVMAFLYLGAVGGVRGSSLSPQELIKLTIPIAWTGLLLHYRHVFIGGETLSRMTERPLLVWLLVLLLMAFPIFVFVAVRDFGQFLTIGVAQILLLAWFSRRPLYILLFGGALAVASIILLGESITFASPIVLVLVTVALVTVALAGLEKFKTQEVLWPSASIVLGGFGIVAWGASLLPSVQAMLSTPRSRFMLWADLYARNGDPSWWDNSRQVIESLYAFDAGGLFGLGLGSGSPFLIPKAGSDFIFASFVEETGLVGGLLILLIFTALVVICLRAATARGRSSFFGLLIAGYAILLGSQAFIHVAGTMNIMPMTGITLPLLSSGTSSMIVTWGMLAVIIGLGVQRKRSNEEGADDFVIVKP